MFIQSVHVFLLFLGTILSGSLNSASPTISILNTIGTYTTLPSLNINPDGMIIEPPSVKTNVSALEGTDVDDFSLNKEDNPVLYARSTGRAYPFNRNTGGESVGPYSRSGTLNGNSDGKSLEKSLPRNSSDKSTGDKIVAPFPKPDSFSQISDDKNFGYFIQPSNPKPSDDEITGKSIDGYLNMHSGQVHIQVLSPNDYQLVTVSRGKIYVNGRIVVADTGRLGFRRSYQKWSDGSSWYTNLPVGDEMTPDEIERFKRDVAEFKANKGINLPKIEAKQKPASGSSFKTVNTGGESVGPYSRPESFDGKPGGESFEPAPKRDTSYRIPGDKSVEFFFKPYTFSQNSDDTNFVDRLHFQVLSPYVAQIVTVRGRSIYVNGKLVIFDGRRLGFRRSYRKCSDGSLWYTNLPVGNQMTPEEIERFKRDLAEIEAKTGKNVPKIEVEQSPSSGYGGKPVNAPIKQVIYRYAFLKN